MKKLVSLMLCLVLCVAALAGCGNKNDEPYTKMTYTPKGKQVSEIVVEVRDRLVEVTASANEQIYIDYYENSKERYDITVSENGVLTMKAVNYKEWTDYIGENASADVRKISLQVPNALLNSLKISTTNEDISVAPLTFNGNVELNANAGNILFEKLDVKNDIAFNAKNGNITGVISGSYDDYAITCNIKKGDSNLPENKENGNKKLNVTANNGNVNIDIKE